MNDNLQALAFDEEPAPRTHVLIPVVREYTGEVVYARIGRSRWAQLFELGSGPQEGTRGSLIDLDNYYGDGGRYVISTTLRSVDSTGQIIEVS